MSDVVTLPSEGNGGMTMAQRLGAMATAVRHVTKFTQAVPRMDRVW